MRKGIKKIIFTIALLTGFAFFLSQYKELPVYADTSCPYTDPQKCLVYFQDQLNSLQDQKDSIQKQLTQEQYTQLSLEDKITYMTNQIAQTQNQIQSLEIQIAANNIQIKLLQNTIQEKEDSIAVMKQEISVLEETVNKRITETYKYSFLNPFDLLLDSKSFSDILSKTKYLIATRNADVASLEDYSQKATALKREEDDLAVEQTNLQSVQDSILAEKNDLDDQKTNLQTQVNEKNNLLAQSQAAEAEYRSRLTSISKAITDADNQIAALMLQLYNTGQLNNGVHVTRGQTIAVDGHTGCAYGTHLHFAVSLGNSWVNPLNYLTYSGGNVTSGVLQVPLDGAYLTQGYSSTHLAIDIVSTTSGNQTGSKYCVNLGELKCDTGYHNCDLSGSYWFNMRGEGAPVKAAESGTIYYYTDQYGGKYAFLVHDTGSLKTLYLHLK